MLQHTIFLQTFQNVVYFLQLITSNLHHFSSILPTFLQILLVSGIPGFRKYLNSAFSFSFPCYFTTDHWITWQTATNQWNITDSVQANLICYSKRASWAPKLTQRSILPFSEKLLIFCPIHVRQIKGEQKKTSLIFQHDDFLKNCRKWK